MKTEIEYLTLLETDLRQAAAREKWMQAAPPIRHRWSWAGWGTFAAGVIGFLVVGHGCHPLLPQV